MSVNDIITTICPGLAADPLLVNYITMATSMTSATFFGTQTAMAIALRACHMWTIAQRSKVSGTGGQLASITEGKLSMSFFAQSGKASALDQTTYGQQLKALMGAGISVLGGAL